MKPPGTADSELTVAILTLTGAVPGKVPTGIFRVTWPPRDNVPPVLGETKSELEIIAGVELPPPLLPPPMEGAIGVTAPSPGMHLQLPGTHIECKKEGLIMIFCNRPGCYHNNHLIPFLLITS
jgi:hypothetical protein